MHAEWAIIAGGRETRGVPSRSRGTAGQAGGDKGGGGKEEGGAYEVEDPQIARVDAGALDDVVLGGLCNKAPSPKPET